MSKDYTSEELNDIAENLIEDLRDCEDGTKMSTHCLLKEAGYDIEEFDIYDLFEIHNALFEAAERNEITLDMSAYDDQVVGLPFNLYYIVKNEKAKIKCPYCGSKNIARILYGSLVYSKALKKKTDDGKIVLGGCCITTVPFHDEVIRQGKQELLTYGSHVYYAEKIKKGMSKKNAKLTLEYSRVGYTVKKSGNKEVWDCPSYETITIKNNRVEKVVRKGKISLY